LHPQYNLGFLFASFKLRQFYGPGPHINDGSTTALGGPTVNQCPANETLQLTVR